MNRTTWDLLSLGITATEILSLSLSHLASPAQAQRRSREQSRSASALSISGGEEKSEHSEAARLSTYSDGGVFFSATSAGTSGLDTDSCGRPAHWRLG